MSAPTCVCCARPMADTAYACSPCAYRAGGQFHEIADMTPAARDVAHGMARSGPGAAGSGEPRLPLNLGATQRLDAVQGILGGWARHVAETRGIPAPAPQHLGEDTIEVAAQFLAGHVEWIRHRSEVGEFLDDVAACARIVAGIARGPAAQRYLGPCGAEIAIGTLAEPDKTYACDGDIYARDGAQHGACRACGATVGTQERQAWLDSEVRSRAYRASEIEDAYRVSANQIRVWAARGKVTVHSHDRQGRALYLLSAVLDYAAATVLQREHGRAKRERRAAQRQTEDAA